MTGVTIDAHLPGGKRADAILTDAQGRIELVIQLEGGSKLANRVDSRGGLPLVVLRAATLADEPHRWRAIREHGMPAWRCRCAGTRSLPVDDDFSLRVIGCPINLRTDDGQQFYARVIEDAAAAPSSSASVTPATINGASSCAVATARRPPSAVPRCPRRFRPESASPNRGWIVTPSRGAAGHHRRHVRF